MVVHVLCRGTEHITLGITYKDVSDAIISSLMDNVRLDLVYKLIQASYYLNERSSERCAILSCRHNNVGLLDTVN